MNCGTGMAVSAAKKQCAHRECRSGKRSEYRCECRLTFYCCRECQLEDFGYHRGMCVVTLRKNVAERPSLPPMPPAGACDRAHREYRVAVGGNAHLFEELADALDWGGAYEAAAEARFTEAHLQLASAGFLGSGGVNQVFQSLQEVEKSVLLRVREISTLSTSSIKYLHTFHDLLGVSDTLSSGSRVVVEHRTWKPFRMLDSVLRVVAFNNDIDSEVWNKYKVNSAVRLARYCYEMGCYSEGRAARLEAAAIFSSGALEDRRLYDVLLWGFQIEELEAMRAPGRGAEVAVLLKQQKDTIQAWDRGSYREAYTVVHAMLAKYYLQRAKHKYDLVRLGGNLVAAKASCVKALGSTSLPCLCTFPLWSKLRFQSTPGWYFRRRASRSCSYGSWSSLWHSWMPTLSCFPTSVGRA